MKNKEITIKDLISLILPKIWLVAIISVLCAGLAFTYFSFFKPQTYTSKAQIYIYSEKSDEAHTSSVNAAKGMVEVYKIMIQSDKFLSQVVSELPEYQDLTTTEIRSMINVVQVNNTEVFQISITSLTPKMAFDVLDKIVDKLPDEVTRIIPNALSVKTIEDPALPKLANSKNEIRNTIVAFFVAAILTMFAILAFAFLGVKIRDKKKIEDNFDLPVLGVIPRQDIQSSTR